MYQDPKIILPNFCLVMHGHQFVHYVMFFLPTYRDWCTIPVCKIVEYRNIVIGVVHNVAVSGSLILAVMYKCR